ncbi:uncharacterized protein LOC110451476, partial [Mizuhopecten yessoensis]|uniref:uncharacterized protein LOC110451476 n=1 Tax=Mizuhopecten yessoensis TaxID=6573 RepID=UPI000B457825
SVVRSDYVAVARTRDAARSFCQTTYHQGTLAKWKDIVNKRSESYQVWDGNSYQLSSLITIKDCTNDTGNTQYVLPDGLHWLDTAAQCQALCGTTTFATRGSFCHCLNESYTPTNDTDCIPMLQKPAALNIRNTEAKTVFQTVTREISSNLSKGRCLAANESDTCQTLMLKRCGDTLNMLCKGGTRIENTWKEAAFGCAAANSFPQPVPEECTIGSSGWLGGFRSLQYVPGSTVGTFCKRLSYSKNNAMPRFKEVSCSSSFKFYCIYNESGYNEICDVTKSSSCDTTLICSDRSGTARCLCSDDKYWYEKYRICTTKKTYGQTCDVNVTGICQEKMSCQPRAGVHMCDCNEQHYWDVMVPVCQPVIPYGGVCNDSNQCFKSTGVSCLSTNDQRACLCVTSSYWSESSLSCIKQHGYKQTCPFEISNSCKSNLMCRNNDLVCACLKTKYWDQSECSDSPYDLIFLN